MGRQSFSRASRLGPTVQKELAEMINGRQLKEFKDTRLAGLISVTDVKVTNGYQHMDVYISVMEDEHREGVLAVLRESVSSIRGEICRRFKLRTAPSLVFHLDDSIERGCKVWNLLDSIQNKNAPEA
jgi:ribosome-binding factor A